jgi:hypothetical protein
MSESAYVYAPRAPHPDTLADRNLLIRDATGNALIVYCPRHLVGGIFDTRAPCWNLFGPITPTEFVSSFERLGILIADGLDLQRWFDNIAAAMPPQPRSSRGH